MFHKLHFNGYAAKEESSHNCRPSGFVGSYIENCIFCTSLPNRTSARLHCRPDQHTAHPRHGPRQADISSVLQLQRCLPRRYSDCEMHHQRQRTLPIHSDHRQVADQCGGNLRSESVCSDWYVYVHHQETFHLAVIGAYPGLFIRRGMNGVLYNNILADTHLANILIPHASYFTASSMRGVAGLRPVIGPPLCHLPCVQVPCDTAHLSTSMLSCPL